MNIAILTVSDRAASGEREDQSGPILHSMMTRREWQVVEHRVIADEPDRIEAVLIEWADGGQVDLILTTGGTGFGPRDHTPESTLAVCDRLAPGLAEAMRAASLQVTPHAMLSRAVAGIRGSTLIVNLPGSPRAAKENLEVILPALPHAVALLTDESAADLGHQPHSQEA
ncbi:MAG: MogA/MoaB family molybdenum cofactor biosynthesis protein [Anaerolineales bacterium]